MLNNQKKLIIIIFILFSSLSLIFIFNLIRERSARQPSSFPFEPTDTNTAYFEIGADKTHLLAGDEVEIYVYLNTTGEDFNTAAATVRWRPDEFSLVGEPLMNPAGEITGDASPTYVPLGEDDEGYHNALGLMGVFSGENMSINDTNGDGAGLYFSLTLRAEKTPDPISTVAFSPKTGNMGIHFVDLNESNQLNQTRAVQTEVNFGALTENMTAVGFLISFDGVPANDLDWNLPDVNRQKQVKMTILSNNGSTVYEDWLDFDYQRGGIWKNTMIFSTEPGSSNYLASGDYVFKIKGFSHRQILFCRENQSLTDVCSGAESININAGGQAYIFDFSNRPLGFGDIDQNGSTDTLDYSRIRACRNLDAKIGDDVYESPHDCGKTDGDFDGVVDSTDVDLIYKTLLSETDDE